MFPTFSYDGIRSKEDLQLTVTKVKHLGSAEKDVEKVHVPGRNGDLLIDNGSYQNKIIEIEAVIRAKTQEELNTIAYTCKRFIQAKNGYNKLIISEDPDYYYEATCINAIDIEEIIQKYSTIKFKFDCKPMKKAKTGDELIQVLEKGTVLTNPSYMESFPYMKIFGNGDIDVFINNQKLELKNVVSYIEVDSEMMNCFKDTYNQNSKMYSDFPVLEPGDNVITWQGTVQKVEILSRWRAL